LVIRIAGGEVDAPADFRGALERTLAEADADERIGSALRASAMRMRFEFPDCDLALNVWAEGGELRWSFAQEPGWDPKLALEMDSEVANAYLQGRVNLPISVAHGRVRCHGSSMAALQYLPLTRLLCGPYRRIVRSEFPALAL
jgi:hypothetical protein